MRFSGSKNELPGCFPAVVVLFFLHFSTLAATAFNRDFHAFILNSLFQVVRETYPDALEQAVFCVPVVKCLVGC